MANLEKEDMGEIGPQDAVFLYLDKEQLSVYENWDVKNIQKYIAPGLRAKSVQIRRSEPDLKRKYRNVYCVNCGEKGHVVRDCVAPITSFGIIAFKVANSPEDEYYDKNKQLEDVLCSTLALNTKNSDDEYPKIKFLMIQRKDTMGYIDFIRGKYPEHDIDAKNKLLDVCLREMIHEEKHNLLTKTFDELWDALWINKNSKTYKNEYAAAKSKFERLDVVGLVENSYTKYSFQEFGFPKGRRNMKETNIACAEREFYEETGYTRLNYDFIKNYPSIHEEFVGTNGIRYRHTYYLVKMKNNAPAPKMDSKNILQTGEVQNMGWLTFDEAKSVIRPYDTAKKLVVERVYTDILNMNDTFMCSSFYYNTSPGKPWDYSYNFKSRSL